MSRHHATKVIRAASFEAMPSALFGGKTTGTEQSKGETMQMLINTKRRQPYTSYAFV